MIATTVLRGCGALGRPTGRFFGVAISITAPDGSTAVLLSRLSKNARSRNRRIFATIGGLLGRRYHRSTVDTLGDKGYHETAWPGWAWCGTVRFGGARFGMARLGRETNGLDGRWSHAGSTPAVRFPGRDSMGSARCGVARLGEARFGTVRRGSQWLDRHNGERDGVGSAGSGRAGHGVVWPGSARGSTVRMGDGHLSGSIPGAHFPERGEWHGTAWSGSARSGRARVPTAQSQQESR